MFGITKINGRLHGRAALAMALAMIVSGLGFLSQTAAAMPMPFLHRTCRDVTVDTTIPSGSVHIYGRYCAPKDIPVHTLQLLVHGGTYNHAYWDFPGFDGKYSYVDAATMAGYATLAVDRLGYGNSSRPVSQDITFDNQTATLHAVVQAVRDGSLGIHVRHIEAVGHSLGSGTVVGEYAAYHDLDAIILTGYGQKVMPTVAQMNALYFTAANYLPRFASLDAGYKTNKPNTRGLGGLYYAPLADPTVIAKDQATEDTVTQTEITSRPQGGAVQTTTLNVPVLLMDGQQDSHYCLDNAIGASAHIAASCSSPVAFYQANVANYPNACFATALVQSGHDINLHVTAPSSFLTLLEWSYATIPPLGDHMHCAITGVMPTISLF